MSAQEPTLASLYREFEEHRDSDEQDFRVVKDALAEARQDRAENKEILRSIHEEVVGGTDGKVGLAEKVRVLEAQAAARKWLFGLLFGGTSVLVLDKVLAWLSKFGATHA